MKRATVFLTGILLRTIDQTATMDSNYHYLVLGGYNLWLRKDAPATELGLNHNTASYPLKTFFDTFGRTPDQSKDAFIDYVLKIDEHKAKNYFGTTSNSQFKIVRVPKEMAKYTKLLCRSRGCCGSQVQFYVEMDTKQAIIDLTKATLQDLENAKHFKDSHSSSARTDPTAEKLAELKKKIAYFENVEIEEVYTPFSKHCDCDY